VAVIGIQEAAVRPVTGGGEEGKHEEGAVYAWPVKEVCRDQEHYDKCGRGGRGDK